MGQEVIIVRMLVRVDVGLDVGDDVSIFQRSDRSEEDTGTVTRGKKYLLLGLQLKVQFVVSGKLEDVQVVMPTGLFQRHGRVEPRDQEFKDPPEKVISISGLHPNQGDLGLNFGVDRGGKSRQYLHHGCGTFCIALS
jgi:hypothetical protein